jgi:PST family polysaccharide transporter
LLRLANVGVTAVVAHILSPRDFGVFAVALTAYVIVSSIAELGVSSILIRADLDIDALAPTVASVTFLSSSIIAGAMVAFARPIGAALGSAAAADPIRVMAIVVLLMGVSAVPNAQMARDFKQDKIFMANAASFLLSTAVLVVLAKSGSGAMAFAWSRVVGQAAVLGVLIAVAPRLYRPGFARSALSVILKFGIPLAGANLVNYILLNVDYAFVGHLLGAADLGVYVLAFTLASAPYSLLGGVINSVSMPAFSRVKHDPDLLKEAMTSALRAVSLIAMPICAMMLALARPLVLTVYGEKWAASANVLEILAFYGVVFIVCLVFANILTSFGRTQFLFVLQLIWIGALVPAMALGVHKDGIVGAAYAHVAVIIPIVLPCYLFALKRVAGVRLAALGRATVPALLASSAAALAARGVASQLSIPIAQLIGGLAVGGLVYLVCAGRQAVTLLGQGRAAQRVLHLYGAAGRLVGLPADGRARHSARRGTRRVAEALHETGPQGRPLAVSRAGQLGPDGLEDLMSRASLTDSYRQAGWLTVAVAMHERTLANRERRLGPYHPHTVACRTNLAYAYRQAGWLTKAIPLYERILADWNRLLGPDHPRTLRSSNYLASAYCEAGRVAEAIPLYEQSFAARRRLLGPGHPSTLRSATYLARVYRQAGRLQEAVPLYEQTLAGWHLLLGPDDPTALRSSNYLARAYREAGRLAEAIPLCEDTLERCNRVLGGEHALTRKVCRNFSMTRELANSQNHHPAAPGPGKHERHEHDAETAERRR